MSEWEHFRDVLREIFNVLEEHDAGEITLSEENLATLVFEGLRIVNWFYEDLTFQHRNPVLKVAFTASPEFEFIAETLRSYEFLPHVPPSPLRTLDPYDPDSVESGDEGAGLFNYPSVRLARAGASKIVKLLGSRTKQKRSSILQEDRIYRDATSQTYKQKDRQDRLGQFQYEPQYSDSELAVYNKPESHEIIIAIRGSVTAEDWAVSDVKLAMGKLKETARYKRNLREVERIIQQNPNSQVVLTGHSLGGGIASQIAKDLDLRVVGFNAAVIGGQNPNGRLYTIKNDLVSAAAPNSVIIDKGHDSFSKAHSMKNFYGDGEEYGKYDEEEAVEPS